MANENDLEQGVLDSLSALQEKYESMKQMLDKFPDQQIEPHTFESSAEKIRLRSLEISELEERSREFNQRYRQSRTTASDAVKAATDRLTNLIQEIVLKINLLENAVKTSRSSLLPHLNEEVRVARMKSAYQQHQ